MKHRGGRNWAAHGLPGVGSDSWLACTQFHNDMEYSNGGGGMDTQPSYRLRHIGTGLGLEEGVDGEPLAGSGSVLFQS
jgi:hypothetical protein